MTQINDSLSSATKTQIEAQIALFNALTNKAFDSIQKVIELNVNATKATVEEVSATARQLLAAKDPQEALAISNAQAQPAAEKALAYTRHLTNIINTTQAEISKTVETQVSEGRRQANALFEDMMKAAPAGSENVVSLFRNAIGSANAGYEQISKGAKQAAEAVQSNVEAATARIAQAAATAGQKNGSKK